MVFCGIVILSVFCITVHCRLNISTKDAKWCPPAGFVALRKKTNPEMRTAVISEIHGQLQRTGIDWGIYHPANLLARWSYYHLVVVGIDKLYLNVLYNDTLHLNPPMPEDIYPRSKSCVVDWFNTGLLHWRTIPYASKNISNWPIDIRRNKPRKPSMYKDLYKSLKSINPTYAVHDVDEYLIPVNWNFARKTGWCKANEPTLISVALQSMLLTATNRYLYSYKVMNESQKIVLNVTQQCKLGESFQRVFPNTEVCRPITSFILPEKIWMNIPESTIESMPSVRSKFHTINIDKKSVEELTQAQEWKSFHYTVNSPSLEGHATYHYNMNPLKTGASVLAPREYHREAVSLEIAHVKLKCLTTKNCWELLVPDDSLQRLNALASECMP